jgi:hypothetical protein
MNDHIRQHWIPDSYLAGWCDPDPSKQKSKRVHRYNKDGSYRDYRPPSRIFTEDDLYTVRSADGRRNLQTEHALTQLEDRFVRIRNNRLVQRLPIVGEARRDMTWFIAAMRNRSPAMHAHQTAFNDRVLKIAASMEDDWEAMPLERRREMAQRMRPLTSPADKSNSIPLSRFREIAALPFGAYLPRFIVIEATTLDRMHLMILHAPTGHSFTGLLRGPQPIELIGETGYLAGFDGPHGASYCAAPPEAHEPNQRPLTRNMCMALTLKPPSRFVAYHHVSIAQQGRNGLGLEAQREVERRRNGLVTPVRRARRQLTLSFPAGSPTAPETPCNPRRAAQTSSPCTAWTPVSLPA